MTVTTWTLIETASPVSLWSLLGDDDTLTALANEGQLARIVAVVGPPGTGYTPDLYGAAGNGTTNDSAAFTTGIAAVRNLTGNAGKSYSIKDVALSNSQSFEGNGTIVSAASGATNIFSVGAYNPRLTDFYISSNVNSSAAAIRIGEARYAEISGIYSPSCGAGFVNITPANPATTFTALSKLSNCTAENVTGTAVNIGSSVVETQAVNLYMAGDLVAGVGGEKPLAGTIGWRQNTPASGGFAVGGHQLANSAFLTFQTGMYLTDAKLSNYTGVNLDSCSGYGLKVDGASDNINFHGLFVGTTRGIYIGGSAKVSIVGLETTLNGTIPSWGSSDFYDGTAYDMELADTAQVTVSGWKGDKRIVVASGATLIVKDGATFGGKSVGTIGAGATTFLGVQDDTTTEADALWRAPYDGYLVRISATPTAAPGAGQTYTYTARVNGSDVALVMTHSGAADFGGRDGWSASHIAVTKGQYITIKLATSAGAATARHWAEVQLVPR